MTDKPTTHNELVELIENNDPGVVADMVRMNYTPNDELRELVERLQTEAREVKSEAREADDDVEMAVWNGKSAGIIYAAGELERMI